MKSMQTFLGSLLLVGMGIAIGWSVKPVQADADKPAHVYELRTYTTEPGKLPNLHARFKNHTMKLFEKYGIKNVIYFTPIDENDKPIDNKLVYLVAHESQAKGKAALDAFRKDPEWIAAREESEKGGKLTTKVEGQFFVPTDYSPMK